MDLLSETLDPGSAGSAEVVEEPKWGEMTSKNKKGGDKKNT